MSNITNEVRKLANRNQQVVNTIPIKDCRYLLPCGRCDKTDEMCSQYQTVKAVARGNTCEEFRQSFWDGKDK